MQASTGIPKPTVRRGPILLNRERNGIRKRLFVDRFAEITDGAFAPGLASRVFRIAIRQINYREVQAAGVQALVKGHSRSPGR